MKQFYSQSDEKCSICGCELPRGSEVWIRGDDEIFCPECFADELC